MAVKASATESSETPEPGKHRLGASVGAGLFSGVGGHDGFYEFNGFGAALGANYLYVAGANIEVGGDAVYARLALDNPPWACDESFQSALVWFRARFHTGHRAARSVDPGFSLRSGPAFIWVTSNPMHWIGGGGGFGGDIRYWVTSKVAIHADADLLLAVGRGRVPDGRGDVFIPTGFFGGLYPSIGILVDL